MKDIDAETNFDRLYSDNSRLRSELANILEECDFINRFLIPKTMTTYLIQIGALKLELLRCKIASNKTRRKIALVREGTADIDSVIDKEFKQWDERLRYESSEIEAAKSRFSSMAVNEDMDEIRASYRELSKKMNPAINSSRSETAASFWERAVSAYAWRDSFQLRTLLMMSEDYPESYEMPFNMEESKKINRELRANIDSAQKRMEELRSHPAFEWMEILRSPELLQKKQVSLRDAIERERQHLTALEEILHLAQRKNFK